MDNSEDAVEKDTVTWSDEEFYDEHTQEVYYATRMEDNSDTLTDKCPKANLPSISSEQKDNNDTTDSENIPLADLGKKSKRSVKRKLIQSDDESDKDDSADDENYVPSKDDINSSDSDSSILFEKKKFKRKEAWKKNPSNIKIRKPVKVRKTTNDAAKKLRDKIALLKNRRKRLNVAENELSRAKDISKRFHSIQTILRKSHVSRLDALLASNELRRVNIYGDGNCFFLSIKISANTKETADELRSNVCDYMTANADKYISFCTREEKFSTEQFIRQFENLKKNGEWNFDTADILPLGIANYLRCTVRIFSSSISTPVIDIKPEQPTNDVINLAYIAVRGQEHYDATQSIANDSTMNVDTSADTTSSELHSDPAAGATDGCESLEGDVQTTPHKRASFKSPKKKHSSRKKKRNPEKWKRNIRKSCRNEGKEYMSSKGKVVNAKRVKKHNCEKCKFKCGDKFTEEQQEDIFKFYYGLGSYERQSQYICDMVQRKTPKRKGKGKKSYSQQFYLVHNARKERVCREFFTRTLDITRKTVDYRLSKKEHGTFGGTDMRGKTTSVNKLDDGTRRFVKSHIQSFPRMESHYVRKSSKKEYLPHNLNITKMYKLYTEDCEKKGLIPVKAAMYRKIFCEEYNYSFFKPKKDQCSFCTLYGRRKESGTLTDELKTEYEEHQEHKTEAREEKLKDKERAKKDSSVYVACFDLQAVLTTPCSLVSELYYSRKLCCYNLTIYSLADKHAVCHIWDETQGKRGSCEIATCLMKNTLSVCSRGLVKEITYYSDSCGGQNRNQYVTASMLYTLSQVQSLNMINHKFLLSGHTQMECDSVHSTIEGAKKITPVHVPSEWSTLISLARRTQPYIAIPMKYNHVINFKDFVKTHCPNLKVAVNGQRINWLQVKWIQVRKGSPRSIFVNYSFKSDQFQEVQVQKTTRQKGRSSKWPESQSDLMLSYDKKLPISVKKKNDLVTLCQKDIIPEEFHGYYTSLPTSNKQKDFVPMESDGDDTDME